MDNSTSRIQQLQQLFAAKKVWIIIAGAALLLLLFSIVALVSSQQQPVPQNPGGPTPIGGRGGTGNTGPQVTPNASEIKGEKEAVLAVVDQVLNAVRSGVLDNATDSFIFGLGYWQTEEALIEFLRKDKVEFTQNGVYQGFTSIDNVHVVSDKAQALVLRTVQGRQRSARYDLQKTITGWKIVNIKYDQKLDLSSVQKLEDEHEEQLENGTYSSRPVTFILPAGDTVEVNKTFFSSPRDVEGTHEDVEISVLNAKANYLVVLYNGSRIVDNGYIRVGSPGTHFHAFDVRPLANVQGGSVIFYAENTQFDFEKLGKPADPLFEIPIKLDFSR
jgi:hypothetical protein